MTYDNSVMCGTMPASEIKSKYKAALLQTLFSHATSPDTILPPLSVLSPYSSPVSYHVIPNLMHCLPIVWNYV